jgi:hypothetical protein
MAKKWTAKEEKYLTKHYGKIPNKELAEHFGVSPKAVANKMYSLRAAEESKPKPPKPKPAKKPAKTKKAPPKEETIAPLSSFGKKKQPMMTKKRKKEKPVEQEQPAEYMPTTIMIMTEDGWQPIKMDKRKVKN